MDSILDILRRRVRMLDEAMGTTGQAEALAEYWLRTMRTGTWQIDPEKSTRVLVVDHPTTKRFNV